MGHVKWLVAGKVYAIIHTNERNYAQESVNVHVFYALSCALTED